MKHICVYFEDGWPDLTCVCGERAVLIADDDGETVAVPLGEPAATADPLLLTA